jgi:hypothetical protein
MTMPHLMNCSHSESGWCLECVKEIHDELEELRNDYTEALVVCYAVDEFLAGRISEEELRYVVTKEEDEE